MSDERMFPLQTSREGKAGPLRIPWSVAEKAYSEYARQYGQGQTLERLGERGGFSWYEMDELYPPWRAEVDNLATLTASLAACREQLAASEKQLRESVSPLDHETVEHFWRTRYTALHRAASQLARMLPGGDSVLMGPIPNCCADELGAVENGIADVRALLTEPAGGSEEKRPTWRATGNTCLNCGHLLTQHDDQRYCPTTPKEPEHGRADK